MSGLLLGIVLSVCTCWFYSMVTLPPWLVSTDFGTCSYQYFLSNCTPVSLYMLKCSCTHTLSCLFMYCSFASIGHADIMWSIGSSNCWQSLHLLSVSVFSIFVAYYYYYYYKSFMFYVAANYIYGNVSLSFAKNLEMSHTKVLEKIETHVFYWITFPPTRKSFLLRDK